MTERICYQFDDFRVDPVKRTLLRNGQPVAITARAFDLLLVLVRNHGEVLTKKQLIGEVWVGTFVAEGSLHVNLTALRRALDDFSRPPKYIVRTPVGYCFAAEVRKVRMEAVDASKSPALSDTDGLLRAGANGLTVQSVANTEELTEAGRIKADEVGPNKTQVPLPLSWHVAVSCSLYALLYFVALLLEVAYQWDQYGRRALLMAFPVFTWMMSTAVLGLKIDRWVTLHGKAGGLVVCLTCFLVAATVLFAALSGFLPNSPITESRLQAYPAQAAYLKDMSYFLILAFLFLLVPFHFVVTMERAIAFGQSQQVISLLTGSNLSVAPRGAFYPRSSALALLLVGFLAMSIAMTARLLDHLKPGPYMNLFTQLVYLRWALYFGLGIKSILWYHRALNELKRESLAHFNTFAA